MPVIAVALPSPARPVANRHPLLRRLLGLLLPAANPEFEAFYPHVKSWWVEVNDSGFPQRELGFAIGGEPIVAGPLGSNMGYWTDSPMQFEVHKYERVDEQAFFDAWSAFEERWNARGAKHAA